MAGSRDQDQPDAVSAGRSESEHARWVAALYGELRALAQSELDAERRGHTLSATALVNEVYLKFSKPPSGGGMGENLRAHSAQAIDRATFFGAAAQAMRRILVDHARGRNRQKRGGGQGALGSDALDRVADPAGGGALDPVALDGALDRLAAEHGEAARVVELRFFAGLPEKTIAEVMGINERTVRRHWTFAKAWLAREMNPSASGKGGSGSGGLTSSSGSSAAAGPLASNDPAAPGNPSAPGNTSAPGDPSPRG